MASETPPATSRGPLSGVRVIDITSIFMGPSATQMMGDLGADVVKVESPGGDVVRHIGPQGQQKMGPLFLAMNRNKRSIVLDLKTPGGRDALFDLTRQADVLAYNVRPQAMALASGGIARYASITIADRSVALYAFGVISAALYGRERTGIGQRLDVPMFETMVPQVLGDHLYGQTFVPAQGDFGYPRLLSPERRPYRTRDGHVCCLIYTDANWKAFLQATGPRTPSPAPGPAHPRDPA